MNSDIYSDLGKDENCGVYGDIKKLGDCFADKFGISRKKVRGLCYEVLLKKSKTSHEGLPHDWDNGDILNAVLLEIQRRCSAKNTWTNDKCNKVLKYFETLYKLQNTDYFENSVGPVLKMLLSIELNAKRAPKIEKNTEKYFSTDIIFSYFNNYKTYGRPKDKMDFFSLPKSPGLPHSHSEGNFFAFKLEKQLLTFDYVFRRENYRKVKKSPNDLDEGFVTPDDDHVEKSPCFDIQLSQKLAPKLTKEKFDWNFNVVSIPPSCHKTWETFNLIGVTDKKQPYIQKDILIQQWLCDSPPILTYISREHLLTEIIALLIGIPSATFLWNGDTFVMKNNIFTDDLTPSALIAFCQDLIEAGTAFKVLSHLSENELDDDVFTSVFKMGLKEYLYKYHAYINQSYTKANKRRSYLNLFTSVKPLIEQVTYLKKVLVQDTNLKGVALLIYLYGLMGFAASSSMFNILSHLFLLPCIYFFRIIDDWVFLGLWNKNLPLTPSCMDLVKDRKSWIEAHKPIHSEAPWFLPYQDLAHCGKALYLLSLSKNSEKFLSLMKLNRPKVKLCLDLAELDSLKEECEKYYEEVAKSFPSNEEKVDLVQCARDASQKMTEAFENRRKEERLRKIEKKKDELCLREEDLVRSAQNKALRKQEDDAVDLRVAKEQEELLHREQQETLEKAKLSYEKYKHILEEQDKRMMRHKWKLKRIALDEKRKEFLSKDLNNLDSELLQMATSEVEKNHSITQNTFDNVHIANNRDTQYKIVDGGEHTSTGIEELTTKADINENMDNSLTTQNSVVNENYLNSDIARSNDENENIKTESFLSTKSVESSDNNGNLNLELINEISSKNNHDETQQNMEINTVHPIEKDNVIPNENKITALERNRLKILGSDLGRGQEIRIHIWSDETERNKRNMLESHLSFDYDLKENAKEFVNDSKMVNVLRNDIIIASDRSPGKTIIQSHSTSKSTVDSENSVFEESIKLSSDILDSEEPGVKENKSYEDSNNLADMKLTVHWTEDIKSNKIGKILRNKKPSLIPDKDIDYALLNKLVNSSLKIVLSTQVKLVNEALMKMFISEFELIKLAQKLREYFFLHGEFGKRLTSSLSKAIELEEPSSLLTFYRLRNILVDACRGDIKELSFLVKETPAAFTHTNSKVLSCLDLTYKFEWPMNLIFTDIAISKYNSIFEYMFSLHRVAWHLEEVWISLNFKPVLLRGHQYTQIQLYRHVMLQFVCTLRSYIVTTVIESCWQNFIKDIQKAKDIDELYRKHAEYIMDIKFKCFLDDKSGRLMAQIQKLLSRILLFCRILRFGEWNVTKSEEYSHSNFKKLQTAFSSFLQLAQTIAKYVEKLVKINYQKELENLYYFLTINSFYIS